MIDSLRGEWNIAYGNQTEKYSRILSVDKRFTDISVDGQQKEKRHKEKEKEKGVDMEE